MAKDRTHLKRAFGSLINNQTAIEGAKFSPWWIGLIFFILGILLPVVPLFVSAATTNGTSFLSSAEYGLGLDKTFGIAMNEIPNALTFDNSTKTISYSGTGSEAEPDLIGKYVADAGNCKDQYELRIYYSNVDSSAAISQYITNKESISYLKGSTTVKALSEGEAYIPTTIYFFKNSFFVEIYGSNSTDRKAYMSFMSDLKCLDYSGDLRAYFCGSSFDKTNAENRTNSYNKLKEFIDITYGTTKKQTMWLGSLLYVGVYAGVNVFMALMIFLMSRGKNNPNNYLNFWQCIKIDWWESLAPGLLGLILGFIFTSNAVMIYVMLIAMRTMWLTTKELRPQY